MNVKLVSVTPDAEKLIVYCARVSSPQNQGNEETGPRLVAYMLKQGHLSPFELGHMTVEIETSRAISSQILRHKSFAFQEFSQRYAEPFGFEKIRARRQAEKNRQSSVDDLPEADRQWFEHMQTVNDRESLAAYQMALSRGIAKECARFLLPMSTRTRLYMCGNLRSWITYLRLRIQSDVQEEHRLIAEECKRLFVEQFPVVSAALEWAP